MSSSTVVATVISKNKEEIMNAWISAQAETSLAKLEPEDKLAKQVREVLDGLLRMESYSPTDPDVVKVQDRLVATSRNWAVQGLSPAEVANFIFSMKDVIYAFLKEELKGKPAQLAEETAIFNMLIDQLGLATFAAYAESRDAYIREQQKSILELSTPVVEVWEGILALPVVGSVDTARTQQMMEQLLDKIVDTGSSVVIIDITGVPVVDTAVAKHLLQTISAARLLGTQCIMVGISARIAQTLTHLGVDLSTVITGTTFARGLEIALRMTNRTIVKTE